jgi:DNA invertase Pin-like site-specific DNA recombinase
MRIGTYERQRGRASPDGKAMFQMLGVFAEFERSIIQERVRAGLARAKAEGKRVLTGLEQQ